MAQAEAESATLRLREAGATIDELRRDAIELAKRLDEARANASEWTTKVADLQAKNMALGAEREADRTKLEEAAAKQASLEATVANLKARLDRDPLRKAARVLRRK